MKIVRLQPRLPDQHHAEVFYRVLLENLDALYSTAKRLTGRADLAEDLVQETARKALEAMPALKDERNIRAWLFRILLNGIRDQVRRKKLWAEVVADDQTPARLAEERYRERLGSFVELAAAQASLAEASAVESVGLYDAKIADAELRRTARR